MCCPRQVRSLGIARSRTPVQNSNFRQLFRAGVLCPSGLVTLLEQIGCLICSFIVARQKTKISPGGNLFYFQTGTEERSGVERFEFHFVKNKLVEGAVFRFVVGTGAFDG